MNQLRHQLGHKSNGAVVGEGANFSVILFQRTCGFHHKFGEFFLHFTNSFSVSFTRSYSSITFNLVLVNPTLFGSFVFFPLFLFLFFVTVDTSCVCQSGYEIVEEGLLNLNHLITRSWN